MSPYCFNLTEANATEHLRFYYSSNHFYFEIPFKFYDNVTYFYINTTNSAQNASLSDNEWHYVCLVVDIKNMGGSIFKDGVALATTNFSLVNVG